MDVIHDSTAQNKKQVYAKKPSLDERGRIAKAQRALQSLAQVQ